MTTDKTGAPTEVAAGSDRFTISVDGQQAGFTEFVDHEGQRIFPHTVVDEEFSGRGLATILVREALEATRDAGMRIVRCARWSPASWRRTTSSTTSWIRSRST